MRKYINDKPEFPQSYAEVSGQSIIFEGHDVPRYVYPDNTEAGDLGLFNWGIDYFYKPVFKEETSGTATLNATKFYSIKVVPIKGNLTAGGLPIQGEATLASIPKQPSAASKRLVFTIPLHPQTVIKEVGFAGESSSIYAYDSSQTWTVNEHIGKALKNVETGLYAIIYRNTETKLFAYGVSFTSGDRYQILESAITRRDIYVAEMSSAEVLQGPETFNYYRVASVLDNTTEEYELSRFSVGADLIGPELTGTFLPPPNANCCAVASAIAICGGGITEETGKAFYEGTVETVQATATADEDIKVEVVDDEYTDATTEKVVRLTLGSALTGFEKAVEGSYVTITDAENTENNIVDARVLRAHEYDLEATAPDGTATTPVLTAAAREDLWTLTCTAAGATGTFSVVGNIAGAQADLTVGTEYTNDYFTMTISDGASDWAEGDFLVFNVIKSPVTDKRWIEFKNNLAVANDNDDTMKIVLTPNYIQGNASGADETKFTRGLESAGFRFPADKSAPYEIAWVDTVAQRLGLGSKYAGSNVADDDIKIESDYTPAFSDSQNPHRFRPENTIDVGDSATGISSIGDTAIIFCKNSVWRIGIEFLGSLPIMISNNVRCPAQFSIVKSDKYIMFYDGTGFSVTDGVSVKSVTSYKARDYLANINKAYEANIRGVYDRENSRFEFVFPLGTDSLNNYGLYITDGSWNCYPVSRSDCNALWTNFDDGNLLVFHGTSGDLVPTGIGTVFSHQGETDGTPDTGEYLFTITGISGQVISVSAEGNTVLAVGDVITVYPTASGGQYRQLTVSAVSKTSTDPAPVTYNITVDSSYDITGYGAGDTVGYGLIPFDYGIKWTDFSSPQYKHQVRALHLDLENAYGIIYIDHFLDMDENPVSTNGYAVYPNNTKLIVPFRAGKCYKYGFRLRGMSLKQVKISAFEVMFDTQI